jgi:hypothetical protein
VNTFFVSDILWGLDRRQSAWLLSNIGDRFGLETDDEVERLEIDFPSDVVAGAGQMYALADKPAERELHFVVFDRRKAEAA